jgi:hypothetical protein
VDEMKSEIRNAIREAISVVGKTGFFSNQDILDQIKKDSFKTLRQFQENLISVALKRIINDVKKGKIEASEQLELDFQNNWPGLPFILNSSSSKRNISQVINILTKNSNVKDFLADAEQKRIRREKERAKTPQDLLAEKLIEKNVDGELLLLEAVKLL